MGGSTDDTPKLEVEVKRRIGTHAAFDAIAQHLYRQAAQGKVVVLDGGCPIEQRDAFVDQNGRIAASQPQYSVLRIRRRVRLPPPPQLLLEADYAPREEHPLPALVTLKGPTVIVEGVATATEDEQEIADELAGRILRAEEDARPPTVGELAAAVGVVARAAGRFGLEDGAGLEVVGGYTTVRRRFEMRGWDAGDGANAVVELDETAYTFGTMHEIEVRL
ncbi:hypothetical protein HDU84_001251, partial [Entophlyctis sp. JEL0112]